MHPQSLFIAARELDFLSLLAALSFNLSISILRPA